MDATSAWAPLTNVSQTVNADGSSTVDITLFSNQAVGQGESLSSPTTRPLPLRSSLIPLAIQSMRSSKPSITASTAAPQDLVAPNVTSGNTDPDGQFISIDFDEQLQTLDAAQLDSLKYSLRIVVDGRELMADAIDSLSIDNMADPAPMGMGMGTSQLLINFKPESQIKQGQSVFVSYDMTMAMANGLQDLSGNTVENFTQVINNSSSIYNDLEAPTLIGSPELSLTAKPSPSASTSRSIHKPSTPNPSPTTSTCLLMAMTLGRPLITPPPLSPLTARL